MENRKPCTLKTICVVIGAIALVAGVLAVLYTFFKKHFKVTFECEDCDICDDGCFEDEGCISPECVDCSSCDCEEE